MDQVKNWTCPNGHVLGQTQRVEVWEGGKRYYVRRLNLYRHAVDLGAEKPRDVDVLGVVEGAPVVICDICGENKEWFLGQDTIKHILKIYRELPKFEELT